MEKEFVPYELAVKLKELGFKENCIRYYDSNMNLVNYFNLSTTVAPLWQQAFDYFREKYNKPHIIDWTKDNDNHILYNFRIDYKLGVYHSYIFETNFKTFEEARQTCLEKLIEIVENNERKT